MAYEEIIVDDLVLEHFGKIHHHAHHRAGHKWENPQITQVWREKVGHHDYLYWVHVKTGHLGNHHHFTLVFEIRHHQEHLVEIHEGHKTFF